MDGTWGAWLLESSRPQNGSGSLLQLPQFPGSVLRHESSEEPQTQEARIGEAAQAARG